MSINLSEPRVELDGAYLYSRRAKSALDSCGCQPQGGVAANNRNRLNALAHKPSLLSTSSGSAAVSDGA
jgi:hypothetical protein